MDKFLENYRLVKLKQEEIDLNSNTSVKEYKFVIKNLSVLERKRKEGEGYIGFCLKSLGDTI